ncbi:hypothetical protein FACS1894126_0960 [Alphaproteobacteria bacterium]|nr:hypothetical protein FACS1894126_0960 [Alphaproteobacteria bacterium]
MHYLPPEELTATVRNLLSSEPGKEAIANIVQTFTRHEHLRLIKMKPLGNRTTHDVDNIMKSPDNAMFAQLLKGICDELHVPVADALVGLYTKVIANVAENDEQITFQAFVNMAKLAGRARIKESIAYIADGNHTRAEQNGKLKHLILPVENRAALKRQMPASPDSELNQVRAILAEPTNVIVLQRLHVAAVRQYVDLYSAAVVLYRKVNAQTPLTIPEFVDALHCIPQDDANTLVAGLVGAVADNLKPLIQHIADTVRSLRVDQPQWIPTENPKPTQDNDNRYNNIAER